MADDELKDVDGNRLIGRRFQDSKSHYRKDGDKIVVKYPVFEDRRPGGLSLDVLWSTDPEPKNGVKANHLAAARDTAVGEGYPVYGWACFKTEKLLQSAKALISRVVHSATPTNSEHGHLVSHQYVAIVDVDDGQNGYRAEAAAKLLAEMHAKEGQTNLAPPKAAAEEIGGTPSPQ
jgi:hypothetical protein